MRKRARNSGAPIAHLASRWPNFVTKRIAKPADIFPVFHDLFKKVENAG